MSNSTDEGGDVVDEEVVPQSEVNAIISAYVFIALADLVGMYLVYRVNRVRKHPAFAVRRFNLIFIGFCYNLLYDLFWIIDGSLSLQGGGSPCAIWEWIDGIYGLLNLEVLLLRALVLYVAFFLVSTLTQNHAHKSKSKRGSGGLPELVINKNRLQLLRRITKPKYILIFSICFFSLFSIMYIINWARDWGVLSEPFGDVCYVSWSFRLAFYVQLGIGALALLVAYKLQLAHDEYKLRREIMGMIALWLVYFIVQQIFDSTHGYWEPFAAYWWALYRILFYSFFLLVPLIMVRTSLRKVGRSRLSVSLGADAAKYKANESLELLKRIMDDKEAAEAYRKFLTAEFNGELFTFLQEAEAFHYDYDKQFGPAGDKHSEDGSVSKSGSSEPLEQRALKIVLNYLVEDAPFELNISSGIKRNYLKKVETEHFLHVDFFREAISAVSSILSGLTLQRFLQTDEGSLHANKLVEVGRENALLLGLSKKKLQPHDGELSPIPQSKHSKHAESSKDG